MPSGHRRRRSAGRSEANVMVEFINQLIPGLACLLLKAAVKALKFRYCLLAHGAVLLKNSFDIGQPGAKPDAA